MRLRASDGFHTATTLSAPFVLNPHPPYALIQTPQDGQVFPEGVEIMLGGSSLTAEGPDAGQFEWRLGGPATVIGTGQVISYTLDQVGQQIFTLRVTANGLSASDTVTVTVVPDYDQDSMPNDWELSYVLNPLDPSDAAEDADNDGLTNLREYQLGTNPRQADTEGDGADDGTEITYGTDPLVAEQVPPSGPVLYVGTDDLTFTAEYGSTTLESVTFWVTNGGPGDLNWNASSDATWLTIAPGNGTAPTEATLTASPVGLPPGTYSGRITFNAPGASDSPKTILVTLRITRGDVSIYLPLVLR